MVSIKGNGLFHLLDFTKGLLKQLLTFHLDVGVIYIQRRNKEAKSQC